MPAKMNADYSAYPLPIQEAIPFVDGEVAELHHLCDLHKYLYMEDAKRLAYLSEAFGPLLAVLQSLLEEKIILSIARLTDQDSREQSNLSIWSFTPVIDSERNSTFGAKAAACRKRITKAVENIRKVRHNQIAHFERKSSLDPSLLPTVVFADFETVKDLMAQFLNIFHFEFTGGTVSYDSLSSGDIIEKSAMTTCKAMAFDSLATEGKIPRGELEKAIRRFLNK